MKTNKERAHFKFLVLTAVLAALPLARANARLAAGISGNSIESVGGVNEDVHKEIGLVTGPIPILDNDDARWALSPQSRDGERMGPDFEHLFDMDREHTDLCLGPVASLGDDSLPPDDLKAVLDKHAVELPKIAEGGGKSLVRDGERMGPNKEFDGQYRGHSKKGLCPQKGARRDGPCASEIGSLNLGKKGAKQVEPPAISAVRIFEIRKP